MSSTTALRVDLPCRCGFGCVCDEQLDPARLSVEEILLEVALADSNGDAMRLLESLDRRVLTEEQRVLVAEAWERQARWVAARQHRAAVAVVGPRAAAADDRDAYRVEQSRLLELSLVTDCGEVVLRGRVAVARLLATTLRATGEALEAGEISDYRARRICEELAELDPAVAQRIEAMLLPDAGTVPLRTLIRRLRRAVVRAQGERAVEQYAQGEADRRVFLEPEPSEPGLLALHAFLPPPTAVAVREALEQKAAEFARADRAERAQAKTAGVPTDELPVRRSKDQRLADALAWFVLGPDPHAPHRPARPAVTVQLTMSLPTLLALRDNPGELAGYGPIPADIARALAADADFQRMVHHPVTGYLLDAGTDTYRFPPAIDRFIRKRDVRCRFPGQRRTARHSDIDHQAPHGDQPGQGGHTSAANGACVSRIGHIAKTHNNWQVDGDANGPLTWTSPSGIRYVTTPHDYRDDDEPPF